MRHTAVDEQFDAVDEARVVGGEKRDDSAPFIARREAVGEGTRMILDELAQTLIATIEAAQRAGDIAPSADAQKLGTLLLAALRGIEALGKGGVTEATLQRAADAAIDVLPRPPARQAQRRRRSSRPALPQR